MAGDPAGGSSISRLNRAGQGMGMFILNLAPVSDKSVIFTSRLDRPMLNMTRPDFSILRRELCRVSGKGLPACEAFDIPIPSRALELNVTSIPYFCDPGYSAILGNLRLRS